MIKWFKKLFVSLVLATARVEKKNIKIDTQESLVQEETGKFQADFMNALMRGEYHQEYVQKFYQILKRSDKVLLEGNSEERAAKLGVHLNELDEKDKSFELDFNIDIGKLDKNHKHYGKDLKKVSKEIIKEKSLIKDNIKIFDYFEKYLIPKGDTNDLTVDKNGEIIITKPEPDTYNIEITHKEPDYRFIDYVDYVVVKHNKNMKDNYKLHIYLLKKNILLNEEEESYKSFVTADKLVYTNQYAVQNIYENLSFEKFYTLDKYFVFVFQGNFRTFDEVEDKLEKAKKKENV